VIVSCQPIPLNLSSLTRPLPQIAIVSIGNSIGCYTSLRGTREVYSGAAPSPAPPSKSPVTPLSARTFGTWTALSSVVRLYAAYHIHEKAVYELCLWTYGIAFAHFLSEWWVFGTAKWGRGLASPVVVSTGTLVWMMRQWGAYVVEG
jgi:hypothetical protein